MQLQHADCYMQAAAAHPAASVHATVAVDQDNNSEEATELRSNAGKPVHQSVHRLSPVHPKDTEWQKAAADPAKQPQT